MSQTARYLKPDSVPQELIERVIYAPTRALTPGNSQEWDFIVVCDPEAKQKIRDVNSCRLKSSLRRAFLGSGSSGICPILGVYNNLKIFAPLCWSHCPHNPLLLQPLRI
jgi:nitroreductase